MRDMRDGKSSIVNTEHPTSAEWHGKDRNPSADCYDLCNIRLNILIIHNLISVASINSPAHLITDGVDDL
jgi:hypothetical protein